MHVSPADLNGVMSIDHVIRVHADGTVSEPIDVWAPEIHANGLNADVMGDWTLLRGYSGQEGYSGPVMHSSEFVGGKMARDILDTPGLYVAVVVYGECDAVNEEDCCPDDCNADHIDGWAVAHRPE